MASVNPGSVGGPAGAVGGDGPVPLGCQYVPPPDPPEPAPLPREAWLRLGLNLVLGIALLAWVRAFTDWWGGMTTLLALGGILSWIGVVSKVVPDERQKEIRSFLSEWVFLKPKARWVVRALGLLLALTLVVGVVEVENATGAGEAVVRLTPPADVADPAAGERLRPGERLREPYFVFGSRKVEARVTGLPPVDVPVRPWWWSFAPARVRADGSFLRPVVLVGAESGVVKSARTNVYRLALLINDEAVTDDAFAGRFEGKLVFVGVPKPDVEIPARLKGEEGWKEALRQPGDRLFPPAAVNRELRPGDQVRAVLIKEDGGEYAPSPVIVVHQPRDRSEIVQGILLSELAR